MPEVRTTARSRTCRRFWGFEGAPVPVPRRAPRAQGRQAPGRLRSPSGTTVSLLRIGLRAGSVRSWHGRSGGGRPGSVRAGRQQQASSNVYCGFALCFFLLQPGSELDNLEEILDDLQNSQLPQLFPDSRPGAPAGSVDKQAIINDLMQLTSDSSPGAAVATQKPAMRISQSSESPPPPPARA